MSALTFTALLCNYNHAHYLEEALENVLSQSVKFDQIIFVDDCSTDHSRSLLQDFKTRDSRIELLFLEKNIGVVAAVNKALPLVKSTYFCQLAVDDKYNHCIVEYASNAFQLHPSAGMAIGNTSTIWPDGTLIKYHRHPFVDKRLITVEDVVQKGKKQVFTFLGAGCIFNKEAYVQAASHLPELAWYADWFTYMILALRYPVSVTTSLWAEIRVEPNRYSAQMHDWKKQKPVMNQLLTVMKKDYPKEYKYFRYMAMLPDYNLHILWWLLTHKEHKAFLTPLLVWRLILFPLGKKFQRLLPTHIVRALRKLLKV